MAQQIINIGAVANDFTGDPLRTGATKINDNFTELYTTYNLAEVSRRTLTPYKLVTYLPRATPYTSPSIVANTPTRILIPTTVKTVNSFAIADIGGGIFAYQFNGLATSIFSVIVTTGITASTNNTVISLEGYVNGVYSEGLSSVRKGSATDVGNLTITGEITLAPNDNLSIFATVNTGTTLTFSRTSINIVERN